MSTDQANAVTVTRAEIHQWMRQVLSGRSSRVRCGPYTVEKAFDGIKMSPAVVRLLIDDGQ